MVIVSLPCRANCGQYCVTGLSRASRPLLHEPVHQQRDERLAGGKDPEQVVGAAADGAVENDPAAVQHADLGRRLRVFDQRQHPAQDVRIGARRDAVGALSRHHAASLPRADPGGEVSDGPVRHAGWP